LNSECTSTSDFLRKLIREKKLAAWVISGRLSSYYLAAIPGFPKIIEKLDALSKDELQFISNRYDMYNTEVNKAVLAFERKKANPIRATDEMIEKIRPSWKEKTEKNDLFDSSLD
jgi:flagellin-specific chaperone FliS